MNNEDKLVNYAKNDVKHTMNYLNKVEKTDDGQPALVGVDYSQIELRILYSLNEARREDFDKLLEVMMEIQKPGFSVGQEIILDIEDLLDSTSVNTEYATLTVENINAEIDFQHMIINYSYDLRKEDEIDCTKQSVPEIYLALKVSEARESLDTSEEIE